MQNIDALGGEPIDSILQPMVSIPLDLSGGSDELAEAFRQFLPRNKIDHVSAPDSFRWNGRLASKEGRTLWQVRSNSDWEFSSPSDCGGVVVLTIPECGGLVERYTDDVLIPGQAQVLNVEAKRSFRAYSCGKHARTALKWTSAEVMNVVDLTSDDIEFLALSPSPVLDLTDSRGQIIRSLLNAVAIDLVSPELSSPLVSSLMNEAVLRLLFEPMVSQRKEWRRRCNADILPRHVKCAVEYMRENAGMAIRIRDVADACRVTPRTLENGFRAFRDTTPIAYLRQVRLEGARRDLQSAQHPARISEIARRWGFADPGRFAERYRREFGELPSETIRTR